MHQNDHCNLDQQEGFCWQDLWKSRCVKADVKSCRASSDGAVGSCAQHVPQAAGGSHSFCTFGVQAMANQMDSSTVYRLVSITRNVINIRTPNPGRDQVAELSVYDLIAELQALIQAQGRNRQAHLQR